MDQRHHALMSGGLGQLRQLLARLGPNADAALAAEGHQLFQAQIVALAGYHNVIKAPPPGLESLFDRMHPIQNFHSDQCRRFMRRSRQAGSSTAKKGVSLQDKLKNDAGLSTRIRDQKKTAG